MFSPLSSPHAQSYNRCGLLRSSTPPRLIAAVPGQSSRAPGREAYSLAHHGINEEATGSAQQTRDGIHCRLHQVRLA